MFTVIVTEKGGSQSRLDFDEEVVTIGRVQGNQVVLPRGNVSKRHARIEVKGGELFLSDLGSTNGTYINGRRITDPTRVEKDDKVYVGEFILGFEKHEKPRAAAAKKPPVAVARAISATTSTVQKAGPPRRKTGAPSPRVSKPKVPRPTMPEREEVPDGARETFDEETLAPGLESFPPADPELEDVGTAASASAAASAQRPRVVVSAARPSGAPDGGEAEPLVDHLLEQVSRQVKRIDRSRAPVEVDEGTAGRVRIVIQDLVRDLADRGKLPPDANGGSLAGRAFRAAVDLGPLAVWLEDPGVHGIRVLGPDSALLLRGDEWVETAGGFETEERLVEVLRCLGAGVQCREDGGVPGLVRYRLEDGPLALVATPPASSGGASAAIHKNLSPRLSDPPGSAPGLGEGARKIVDKVTTARARLCVVGDGFPVRMSVLTDLARALPPKDLVVGVERLPVMGFGTGRSFGITTGGLSEDDENSGPLRAAIQRASDTGAEWIVACGARQGDAAALLATATGRRGVLADLPLGGRGDLDRELAACLAAGGSPVSTVEAAGLLDAAFDAVIVAEWGGEGRPLVSRILTTGTDSEGRLSPKAVYDLKSG